VNLIGPFRLAKAVVGSMAPAAAALIVGTLDAAVVGYPGWGAYGVAKAALDHLLKTWAAELGDSGVRFLSIDPGEMDTDMHAAALPDADRASVADPADVAARIAGLLETAESIANGGRLEISHLGAPA
jgi:NAD(P)-dependent dehydrogenase (short-subunit alcohol dehydrogenase family)